MSFEDTTNKLLRHNCGLSPAECQQYHRSTIAKEDRKIAALTVAHQAGIREELKTLKRYGVDEVDHVQYWHRLVATRLAELQASQSEKGEE